MVSPHIKYLALTIRRLGSQVWEFYMRFEYESLVAVNNPVLQSVSMLLLSETVLGMVGFLLKATLLTELIFGAVECS